MFVLVEDSVQPLVSSHIQAGELARVGNRWRHDPRSRHRPVRADSRGLPGDFVDQCLSAPGALTVIPSGPPLFPGQMSWVASSIAFMASRSRSTAARIATSMTGLSSLSIASGLGQS